jgi:hypothetical protein
MLIQLGVYGFVEMVIFVSILAGGLIYGVYSPKCLEGKFSEVSQKFWGKTTRLTDTYYPVIRHAGASVASIKRQGQVITDSEPGNCSERIG